MFVQVPGHTDVPRLLGASRPTGLLHRLPAQGTVPSSSMTSVPPVDTKQLRQEPVFRLISRHTAAA